jgi:hypothetical protein
MIILHLCFKVVGPVLGIFSLAICSLENTQATRWLNQKVLFAKGIAF